MSENVEDTMRNRIRQEEEMFVLSNIYSYRELSYSKQDIMQCYYNIFPTVNGNSLRLENLCETFDFSLKYHIKYLPPVQVYLQLPIGYPTKQAPNFYITSSWLSPWQISLICQQLDEIWLQNKGQEILFLWFEFLRNDLLNFLKIKDTLDISFIYMVYCSLTNYFEITLRFQCDVRAKYNISFTNPILFLISYNRYEQKIEWENSYHMCIICFNNNYGKQSIKLKSCNHIYCKECMQQYIAINIADNNANYITCPDPECSVDITFNEIKEFCPELFPKYDNLLLMKTLNTMKDIVFCPRIFCQYPSIRNMDSTLAICSNCNYSFCTYCCKVYHGVAPCVMSSDVAEKLIEEYQNSDAQKKKFLEEKYGRKQIEIVVEKYLTNQYLKKYAKACPNCSTMIVKIAGCNKMTCKHCKTHFCWLCGIEITTKNAYDHFLSNNLTCYKRLFE